MNGVESIQTVFVAAAVTLLLVVGNSIIFTDYINMMKYFLKLLSKCPNILHRV